MHGEEKEAGAARAVSRRLYLMNASSHYPLFPLAAPPRGSHVDTRDLPLKPGTNEAHRDHNEIVAG